MSRIAHTESNRMPALTQSLSAAIAGTGACRFGKIESEQERRDRERRKDPAPGLILNIRKLQPSQQVIAEAKAILPAAEHAMRPMEADRLKSAVDKFLDMLNAAVANPQDEAALTLRKKAITLACEGVPALVWTKETMKAAIRRFKFFPSAAEFEDFIIECLSPHREQLAALRLLSRAQPSAGLPPRTKPTTQERRAVADKVAAVKAAQEARDEAERKFGMWVPEGGVGLTGSALIEKLREAAPGLTGLHREIVLERIEMLERRDALLASFTNS